MKKNKVVSKKEKKSVYSAIAKIIVSFNNTVISVVDMQGNVLCWATAGGSGFKGSKKSTPYAAQVAAESVCKRVQDFNVKKMALEIRGPGAGRESVLRAFSGHDFEVVSITDKTPVAHNGCRLSKRRRV